MDARKVIADVVADSGMSKYRVSLNLGRDRSFISSTVAQGKIPTIETMAEIGDVTGHDVIVRNRKTGREITIDPPDKSDKD